jgi:hypothetical protein
MKTITIKVLTEDIVSTIIDKYNINTHLNKKYSGLAIRKYITKVMSMLYDEVIEVYYSNIENVGMYNVEDIYMITSNKLKKYIFEKAGVDIIEKASIDADKVWSELEMLEDEVIYE